VNAPRGGGAGDGSGEEAPEVSPVHDPSDSSREPVIPPVWSARTIAAAREAGDERASAHRVQQRMVAVRLLALMGVLIWAIVKMNPAAVKPEGRWELARPATLSERALEGNAPTVVDLSAAMEVMDDVAARGGACPAKGVLSVELGPGGLVRARLAGEGNLACLSTVVWAAPWPRAQQAFLLDQSLAKVAPATP
jgi:hypothetical protein